MKNKILLALFAIMMSLSANAYNLLTSVQETRTEMQRGVFGGIPDHSKWQFRSFDWLRERYIDSYDLRGLSKYDKRLLRNAIYAMNGYIFSDKNLENYFYGFYWYRPYTKNVRLSKIEQYNVNFIKRYE